MLAGIHTGGSGKAPLVRPPDARSHGLESLPVQRSVLLARSSGRDGRQAASRQLPVLIRYPPAPDLPALRSRRRGQHLMPSRIIVNKHIRTLRAKAGYDPHCASPACRFNPAQ